MESWKKEQHHETRVQTQVESYQSLKKKWYLIVPCLTLSTIRWGSRVKWSNPGNWVAPSPIPQCRSYWKGNFRVPLNKGHELDLLLLYLQRHAIPSGLCIIWGGSFQHKEKKVWGYLILRYFLKKCRVAPNILPVLYV